MSNSKFNQGDFVKHKLNKETFIVIRRRLGILDNEYVCRNKGKDGQWHTNEFCEFELEKTSIPKKIKG